MDGELPAEALEQILAGKAGNLVLVSVGRPWPFAQARVAGRLW